LGLRRRGSFEELLGTVGSQALIKSSFEFQHLNLHPTLPLWAPFLGAQ
jgi:hypothetical protein